MKRYFLRRKIQYSIILILSQYKDALEEFIEKTSLEVTHPPVRSPPPLFLNILHIVVIANLKTHCLVLKAFRRRRHTGGSVKRQPSILASLLPRALRYVARLTFKLKCYLDQQQGNFSPLVLFLELFTAI